MIIPSLISPTYHCNTSFVFVYPFSRRFASAVINISCSKESVLSKLCKLVNEQVRLKYDLEFHAHFANPISELIYDSIRTVNKVMIKDLLCFVNDQEIMQAYVEMDQELIKETVGINAGTFLVR